MLSEDRLLGLMPWVSRWNGGGGGNVVVVVVVVVAIDDRQQTTKKTARNMLKNAHCPVLRLTPLPSWLLCCHV